MSCKTTGSSIILHRCSYNLFLLGMGAQVRAEHGVYRVSAEGFLQGSSGEVPSTGDQPRAGEDDTYLKGNLRN